MQVAILGDTHVPTREPEVPRWVLDVVASADHVLFTGDFDTHEAAESLVEATDGGFTAVAGNMDPPSLDWPSVATVALGGVEFVLTHGTGSPATFEYRVASAVRREGGPDAVGVAGHTHEPLDATVDGTRILNPGSATGAAPAEAATLLVAEVAGGELSVNLRGPP